MLGASNAVYARDCMVSDRHQWCFVHALEACNRKFGDKQLLQAAASTVSCCIRPQWYLFCIIGLLLIRISTMRTSTTNKQ